MSRRRWRRRRFGGADSVRLSPAWSEGVRNPPLTAVATSDATSMVLSEPICVRCLAAAPGFWPLHAHGGSRPAAKPRCLDEDPPSSALPGILRPDFSAPRYVAIHAFCGDDRVIMASRSPTVSRRVGFVKFKWISTFLRASSSGIVKDLNRFLTLDAETLQSGDQHTSPSGGRIPTLGCLGGRDTRPERGGGIFLEEARWHARSIKIASKPVSPVRRSASTAGTPVSA